jgi:DNA-directed RNA polymerase subunit RPC12/RpoP
MIRVVRCYGCGKEYAHPLKTDMRAVDIRCPRCERAVHEILYECDYDSEVVIGG